MNWMGIEPASKDALRREFPIYEKYYSPYLKSGSNPEEDVLDFGCGYGGMLLWLKEKGIRPAAIEIDYSCCRYVEKNFNIRPATCRVNGKWHCIVARQSVYYTKKHDVLDLFEWFYERLNSDGTLLIEVFNGVQLFGKLPELNDRGIEWIPSESFVSKTLLLAGFSNISIIEILPPITGIRSILWRAARRIWFTILKGICILERGVDENNPKHFGKNLLFVARK